MPNRVSKHLVLPQISSGYVRKNMVKSERVEVQESLHTTGGPTHYLCSATTGRRKWNNFFDVVFWNLTVILRSLVPTWTETYWSGFYKFNWFLTIQQFYIIECVSWIIMHWIRHVFLNSKAKKWVTGCKIQFSEQLVIYYTPQYFNYMYKCKGKVIPLEVRCGTEGG